MKKLIKNKYLVLAICIIIISIIYIGFQKIVDNRNVVTIDEEYIEERPNDESIIFTDEEIDIGVEGAGETEKEEIIEENVEENQIYVHITGEVNNPGVIVLKEGSRVVDAINVAGGTTANADLTKINLVYILEDGMKVNIPNNTDLQEESDFEYITKKSGEGREDLQSNSDNIDSKVMVNINNATQTELESLPGIGPSLALKIIKYRKENGKFSSIEDIKNVSGIGESKFNDLKKYITI